MSTCSQSAPAEIIESISELREPSDAARIDGAMIGAEVGMRGILYYVRGGAEGV